MITPVNCANILYDNEPGKSSGSKGQGHKAVDLDVCFCFAGIKIQNINTELCIGQKVQTRLKIADRRANRKSDKERMGGWSI